MMEFEKIKNEVKSNGWDSQPDKLFLKLLKEIIDKKCICKEYTVECIVKKLDEMRQCEKVSIENDQSYNMAKKVMLSNRNGRDYFIFNNRQYQNELTEILQKKKSGFEWSNYYNENVIINPKYIDVFYAGKNEKKFICKFEEKYGSDILKGKLRWGEIENVNISVDNSIIYNNKRVLIEIDSGNMAKLLVGQYFLLNKLITEKEKKETDLIFVVVHYYKDYNIERTEKNLELVKKCIGSSAIKFKVFTEKSFMEYYDGDDIEGLINKLFYKN